MNAVLAAFTAPKIDYGALAPLLAVAGGSVLVLLVGLLPGRAVQRFAIPWVTVLSLVAAIALAIVAWDTSDPVPVIPDALAGDTLMLGMTILVALAGLATVALSWRSTAVRESGSGEYHSMLLASIAGMVVLAGAENLVTLFIGIELLSIPLYVLCGSEVRRASSLESGLKYLVIGSLGSATLLYGLALVYGATGSTAFEGIRAAIGGGAGASVEPTDIMLLAGVALSATGLAFKASVAPFHQWTPDVYQGAPTPITAFMAVATKTAAFAILLRFFDFALPDAQLTWGPALAALATITIVVGNVGAIGQDSLKRMLAWSGVAQAGYLLAGVVVGTELGLEATAFYLAVYLLMNVAAFAVVIARERVSEHRDGIRSLDGLGRASPWMATAMTIAMLALAGIPGTAGFFGKFFLIEATVQGGYTWLGVVIVIGSMISLAYYLRVVATMWMGRVDITIPGPRPRRVRTVGGWSPEAEARRQPEVALVAILAAAATIVLGIVPQPLFDAARDVGAALGALV